MHNKYPRMGVLCKALTGVYDNLGNMCTVIILLFQLCNVTKNSTWFKLFTQYQAFTKEKKSITKCIRNSITVFTEQGPIDKGYPVCICSVSYVMI